MLQGFRSSFASRKKSTARKDTFNVDAETKSDTSLSSPRSATVTRSKSARLDTPPGVSSRTISSQGSTDKEDAV